MLFFFLSIVLPPLFLKRIPLVDSIIFVFKITFSFSLTVKKPWFTTCWNTSLKLVGTISQPLLNAYFENANNNRRRILIIPKLLLVIPKRLLILLLTLHTDKAVWSVNLALLSKRNTSNNQELYQLLLFVI